MKHDPNPFTAPAAGVTGTVSEVQAAPGDGLFDRDVFLLKQKLFAIFNEVYKVYDDQETVLLYVKRPGRVGRNLLAAAAMIGTIFLGIALGIALVSLENAITTVLGIIVIVLGVIAGFFVAVILTPRREMMFCRDEALTQRVLHVTQDNRVQLIIAHFTLRDGSGTVLCRFRKNKLWDLFRRRWEINSASGEPLWMAKEDSIFKSIIRRLAPDFIAAFMRTNFIFTQANGSGNLGAFNRKLAIRDHYRVDMTADSTRSMDRRIVVATAVLLDTGERR